MSHLRQNISTATANATGVASAVCATSVKVFMGGTRPKVTDLSALVGVTANTSGLTMKPQWQVSVTGSTWYNVSDYNASTVNTLATGASGGGNVTAQKVIIAPPEIKGWAYARLAVLIGGATGTTNDVISVGYSYRQTDGS